MDLLRQLEKPLFSNGYPLSDEPNRLGALNPTQANLPIYQIREIFALQGCVWLKGFFDKAEVLSLRSRFFNAYKIHDCYNQKATRRKAFFQATVNLKIIQKF